MNPGPAGLGAALTSARHGPPYAHPHANRTARLDSVDIAYLLQRSRRRSIGFIVGADGLCVRAPTWAALRDVDAALVAKAGWVIAKLQAQVQRLAMVQAQDVLWGDGAAVPYLGATLTVQWVPGRTRARMVTDHDGRALLRIGGADHGVGGGTGSIRVASPGGDTDALKPGGDTAALKPGGDTAALKHSLRGWLQREARRVFAERCAWFMPLLGVQCTRLSLSSARTRWGSASSNGAIRLNWRLIHFSLSTIDYVVVHELAHLREMNHGRQFWAIVEAALPGHSDARRALREAVLPNLD